MKCEHCKDTIDDPNMESFLCCSCGFHYCFFCTDVYIKYKSELMIFSNKNSDNDSLEWGYNNYRNIKPFLDKFYCEHCLK